MSNVLFLNVPDYGHVNPTLGIVSELVHRGEKVVYFSIDEFKDQIEKAGAYFKSYNKKINPLAKKKNTKNKLNIDSLLNNISEILKSFDIIINDILSQTAEFKFDYIIYSSMFPFGNVIAKILKIPSVSSFEVFATFKEFMGFPQKSLYIKMLNNSA